MTKLTLNIEVFISEKNEWVEFQVDFDCHVSKGYAQTLEDPAMPDELEWELSKNQDLPQEVIDIIDDDEEDITDKLMEKFSDYMEDYRY